VPSDCATANPVVSQPDAPSAFNRVAGVLGGRNGHALVFPGEPYRPDQGGSRGVVHDLDAQRLVQVQLDRDRFIRPRLSI
jgi:hypothetical protein